MRVRALLTAALIMLLLPAVAQANYPHVVQAGETLTSVAATDGLSLDAIAAANGISTQAQLVAGQVLWIPPRTLTTAGAGAAATGITGAVSTVTHDDAASSTSTSAATTHPHVVQPGETLTSVAAAYGLSIKAVAAANGISTQSELVAGHTLRIPSRTLTTTGAGAAATDTTGATATTGSGVAQTQTDPDNDGDNDADNGADSTTTLVSTTSQRSTTSQTAATGSSATQGQTAYQNQQVTQGVGSYGVPVPTTERVSAGEIATVANTYGVPAAFAEAIAWQESGWNNDEVSGAGAVGVMQIVPATWTWIDRYLTPSNPLGTASAAENVRAGVLLLRQLLQLTGGNEQLAAAGYFQGLASVRAHGMYASTRRYVNDVMALTQRL